MQKIVVTGALGHIGSYAIRRLPESFPGVSVLMIDNLSTQRFSSLYDLPAYDYRFAEADVRDADLDELFDGAACVLHLAAMTDAAGSFENRERMEQNNFNATRKVAEACARSGAGMIHISSTSVYGTSKTLVDESCSEEDLNPQSPYAETKLKEERFLAELRKREGLRFAACRFGTIAGTSPGMRFHTAVNKFCWQAVFGKPVTVWTTALDQKRPYLDLHDALRAVDHIVRNDLLEGEIYNILTDNHTVREILEMIGAHVGTLVTEYVDSEIMNQLSYEVSPAKFERTGFDFEGSIGVRIEDTIGLLRNSSTGLRP